MLKTLLICCTQIHLHAKTIGTGPGMAVVQAADGAGLLSDCSKVDAIEVINGSR